MSVLELWWLSLAIFAVVVIVLALLLGLIIGTAKSIDRHAHAIWVTGKRIAGNTVSIWLLEQINYGLFGMVDAVEAMDQRVASLEEALRRRSGSGSGPRR
jgi:hypothetical protein